VESVKAYIQDAEDEEQAREATNRQIKAEKAEAARLEAERQEAEKLAREQAEAEAAEQARQEAERQAQLQQAQQVQAQTQKTPTESATTAQSGVLTKEGGVNYYNGSRETWYSSNQLYHYRTSEWTAGTDGVYRDKDGYVVVARSDMAQGATLETSLGTGKVYDSGCANGTTDIYTKW
jgi:multidrug efflux pump subunit AcrA (membrane-fusion protein)